jgi:hypothetical protein
MIFFSLYHWNLVTPLSPLSIHRLKVTKMNFHIKIVLQLGPKIMQLRKKKFKGQIKIKVKILNNRFTIKCERVNNGVYTVKKPPLLDFY